MNANRGATPPSARWLGLGLLAGAALANPGAAADWLVSADSGLASIHAALARVAPGDTVRVRGGVHRGPLRIDRSLRLLGEDAPVIDGAGQGSVIRVRAPRVTVRGFTIRNSGASLDQENSGIAVDESPDARIVDNRMEDVLFGVYLRESPNSLVSGNRIVGKRLALPRRGDAIRVWHSDGVTITRNEVVHSRDVVLWYSRRLQVRDNRITSGRYGLHFMYCDDATISGNLIYDSSVGAFLMYSRNLRLIGNTIAGSHGPSGYGVGLKDMDDALLRANSFVGNRIGAFLDNSPREMRSVSDLEANLFAGNDSGVVLLPNVRRARFSDNSFLENREQVGLAGAGGDPESNRWHQNHWSDYSGYDGDGDGYGDTPYRSERLFERLSERLPQLQLFRYGLTASALDFAARAFPVVRPRPKLVDRRPRMRPPPPPSVPALPVESSASWTPAAAGMLVGAFLLATLPAWRVRPAGAPPPEGRADERRDTDAAIITGRRVTKRFGDRVALDHLDFRIREGEAVVLWGPNGAGKTTALRAILGIVPFAGSLSVAGKDPRRDGRAVRRLIGFVPQETALQGDLGVAETLELFARLRRVTDSRQEELMAWLELSGLAAAPVATLSGGMRQRLALGVALLADPPILLLDEPTANLDAASRGAFYRLLAALKRLGKTLIFTTHRLEEVVYLADRVLYLEAGRLVADGPPDLARLAGSTDTRLQVRVPERQVAEARELLIGQGFEPRRIGPLLVLTVSSRRKVEPLALLFRAGVEVEDLALSQEVDSDARAD